MQKRYFYILSLLLVLQSLGILLLWGSLPDEASLKRLIPAKNAISRTQFEPSHKTDTRIQLNEERLRLTIASLVREELSKALEASDVKLSSYQPDEEKAKLSKEELQQQKNNMEKSQAIISQAVSEGIWDTDDTRALYIHSKNLTKEQRLKLLDQIYDGFNKYSMELDGPMPGL